MQQHLKFFFILVKVENVGINKVLVDKGATINIMPHSMLRKIGKLDTDLRPPNMVLLNYEGKIGTPLGIIQVDFIVGTIFTLTFVHSYPNQRKL